MRKRVWECRWAPRWRWEKDGSPSASRMRAAKGRRSRGVAWEATVAAAKVGSATTEAKRSRAWATKGMSELEGGGADCRYGMNSGRERRMGKESVYPARKAGPAAVAGSMRPRPWREAGRKSWKEVAGDAGVRPGGGG